ncbi:MAG: helix-turn-helix domain-containing protein [Candidatus Onthomonas sp.]
MESVAPLVHECCHKDSDCTIRIHFHNACELLFIRRGAISIRIDGRAYDAGPGALLVIGRLEEHDIQVHSAEYERDYVIFDPAQLEHLMTDRRLLAPLRNRPEGFSHLFDLSGQFDRICQVFQALCQEWEHPEAYSDQLSVSLLTELLVYMQRTPNARQDSSPVPPAVLTVQNYIENHFAESISISDLAAQVYLTPCYLTHCFKDATGYSPKQYLVLHRISRAKELLAETDLPVAETAYRSGFSDVNNFIRTFKRDTGLTPLRYRELHRQTQV